MNEIAENIYLIDNQLYSIPECGSVYLIDEENKALVDTGPTTSVNAVLSGIRKVGFSPEDIDYVIVTHIHLDHAGGAGALIKHMPKAQLVVHHRGAKHMVDPSRLVSGMLAVQGKKGLERNGEVVPTDAGRVRSVYDGDELKLGTSQVLRFIDAPGHAPHELCIYESKNNGVFTGDAAGLYVAIGDGVLTPSTPPPNFDGESYINTIQRLMKLNPSKIYFAHFGTSTRVQEDLRKAMDRIQVWDDMVAKAIKEDKLDGLVQRMVDVVAVDLEPIRKMESLYKQFVEFSLSTNAGGYIEYYREKHKAKKMED